MVELLTGPNGSAYAKINGVSIHSRYSPEDEAQRFLSDRLQASPSALIILGPGMGYLIRKARALFPEAKIFAIFYHKDFFDQFDDQTGSCTLLTSKISLSLFLKKNMHDLDIEGLEIIEWPQSAACSPEQSVVAHDVIRQWIQQLRGNFLTTDSFGKRLIQNAFQNYIFHNSIRTIKRPSKPLFIAASGVSLELSADFLHRYQDKFNIIALPSSISFLAANNIAFDSVLFTDPGYYSGEHYHNLLSKFQNTKTLIKSLGSRFLSALCDAPTVFIGADNFFEFPLLSALYGTGAPVVPENGTVAGTALSLAGLLQPPFTVFAGLDFCYSDLLSHVRPHPFYRLFFQTSSRTVPYHTSLYARRTAFLNHSNAFSVYSGWFNNQGRQFPGKVYLLNRINEQITFPLPAEEADIAELLTQTGGGTGLINVSADEEYSPSPTAERTAAAGKVLVQWIDCLVDACRKAPPSRFSELESRPLLFQILYTLSPIRFKEYKKALRGKEQNHANRYYDLLDEAIAFFKNILTRVQI